MGVINLVLGTVTAVLFAILLSEFRFVKGKKLVQTISYLPHFLSWVIVTGIVFDVLSTENGKEARISSKRILRPALTQQF